MGYTKGAPGNGGEAPPGAPQGELGSTSQIFPKLLEQTVWIAGSTVEVGWGITANHGGGYQYRLCPANEKTTEKCFQAHPLDFVGEKQWIQYGHGKDVSNRTEIPAVTVSGDKVVPAGSMWRRNPIPPCNTPIFWCVGWTMPRANFHTCDSRRRRRGVWFRWCFMPGRRSSLHR